MCGWREGGGNKGRVFSGYGVPSYGIVGKYLVAWLARSVHIVATLLASSGTLTMMMMMRRKRLRREVWGEGEGEAKEKKRGKTLHTFSPRIGVGIPPWSSFPHPTSHVASHRIASPSPIPIPIPSANFKPKFFKNPRTTKKRK